MAFGDKHKIYWNDNHVGWFTFLGAEMWRYYGKWKSAQHPTSDEFLKRLEADELLWVKLDSIESEQKHYVDYPIDDDDYMEVKFPVQGSTDTNN